METDDVGKLQKEIRSLKKQVERLEASRATFELMVDRNDKLLSRQLSADAASGRRAQPHQPSHRQRPRPRQRRILALAPGQLRLVQLL